MLLILQPFHRLQKRVVFSPHFKKFPPVLLCTWASALLWATQNRSSAASTLPYFIQMGFFQHAHTHTVWHVNNSDVQMFQVKAIFVFMFYSSTFFFISLSCVCYERALIKSTLNMTLEKAGAEGAGLDCVFSLCRVVFISHQALKHLPTCLLKSPHLFIYVSGSLQIYPSKPSRQGKFTLLHNLTYIWK